MAKQPYIQFYIGDYIKDTRVLPLNVKGGWVDLILAMWDNDPKGEITGTIEDFSRVMNCTKEESILVIQTLKQKKIFAWVDLEDGQTKIISRKQKRMVELSETRKKVGELGGNPVLVKQNLKKEDKQKDKLNTEYEYEYINDNNSIVYKMFEIFKKMNFEYPEDKQRDYTALYQIGLKITKSKKLEPHEMLNGKMPEVLKSWELVVNFIVSDKWFSTRSLFDINNEWQRLIQSMTNKNKNGNTENNAKSVRNAGALQLLAEIKRDTNR